MAALTQTFRTNRRYLIISGYLIATLLILAWLLPIIGAQRPYRLVQSTITGLLVGGVYSLIALGIVIINKASGVFNFAHGWMMLLGGLIFFSFYSAPAISPVAAIGLPLVTGIMVMTTNSWRSLTDPRNLLVLAGGTALLAVILSLQGDQWELIRAITAAAVGGVLIGLVIERFNIRPLIGQPLFAMVLMTLAVSELLHGITQLIWGSVELPLQVFGGIQQLGIPAQIRFGEGTFERPINVRADLLLAFLLALTAFGVFVAFFRFTSVGLSMRAIAENQKLGQSVGLRVRTILAIAWAIAALLAAVAGVLQGGATSLSLNLPLLALLAFPAVLLGGLESIPGALIGGLVIGLAQELSNLLFPGTQVGTELAPYVILMIVLVIRPDGLFGEKRIERI
ncbi:MAG: branched-chain amino acid ABC transporter permease [Chloroflexi bacterium]|uniref:branched-chain amino acid ABC transporter permease n=1 Tax=Candidatus Flexifilum breve TaxID=3140694 RepID=UPI003136095C|nr:branched-chain amino acid ABC transporter permease [Chloroflexota bacterium]